MKKFGLIGEKLGHSYSPLIHSKFGDYEYELCEAKEEELEALLKKEEYGGFNITIPYKKTVLKLCDEISDTARAIGSVNTIIRSEDGKLKGYNTDYDGFIYLLKAAKIDVKGMKCMVLGSGGASLTVQTVLADMGASEIVIISRKGENNYENINRHFDSEIIVNTTPVGMKCMVLGSGGASLTVQTVLADMGASEIVIISRKGENNYENINRHFDSEIIVNTTPVGMYPGNGRTPVNLDDFKNCRGVVDLIYNPNKTKLVLDAMAKSLPATGGLAMLVAQAKESSEFFQNKKIEDEEIENAIDEVRSETLNAILIGMPGAGKTLLGKEIADRMGREFVDIDDMIVEHEGMSIPEIFEKKGESYFRKVETEMLEQACVKTGLVIATGGGIVKKKLNYNIIKQNGVVIWIKRDLDKLETDGRPLSQSMPLDQMYEERKDAYSYWSDFFINNNEERE